MAKLEKDGKMEVVQPLAFYKSANINNEVPCILGKMDQFFKKTKNGNKR